MPEGGYSEDALVERPTMALLGDLGWETLSGYDEHPGSGGPIGRETFTETILEQRLFFSWPAIVALVVEVGLAKRAGTAPGRSAATPNLA